VVTNTIWLARCLGPSRLVRREEVSLAPGNLEADREGRRSSAWYAEISRPDEEGKRDWYVTPSVTENGCLPYKMVLAMLTVLPGVRSKVIGHT